MGATGLAFSLPMDFLLSTSPFYGIKKIKKRSPNPRKNPKIIEATGLAFSLPMDFPLSTSPYYGINPHILEKYQNHGSYLSSL